MDKTKESESIRIGEDHAKARNGRWRIIVAMLVGLAVYSCLRIFLSSPQEAGISVTSKLAFARELDGVMGNGSGKAIYATDDDDDDDDDDMETKLVPSIVTRRPQRVFELPYEEQKGAWTGNHWIPPNGWRHFSPQELLTVYKNKSIMWVGDSLARRAAGTLYGILKEVANDTNVNVNVPVNAIEKNINLNKGIITEHCRKWLRSKHKPRWCRTMPGGVGDYVYVMKNLFRELLSFVEDEVSGESKNTENFDTIIIAMGNWDQKEPTRNESLSNVAAAIDVLAKLQSVNKTIIWRTSGFHKDLPKEFMFELNKRVLDQINSISTRLQQENNTVSNLTCINWAGAVLPRSFGSDRIHGDTGDHYGLEARLVLVQMVTNQLASRQGLEVMDACLLAS
jgi:hypothetical protein